MVRMRHPSECARLYYARLLRLTMSVNIALTSACPSADTVRLQVR
jgi:hypothetical protein